MPGAGGDGNILRSLYCLSMLYGLQSKSYHIPKEFVYQNIQTGCFFEDVFFQVPRAGFQV